MGNVISEFGRLVLGVGRDIQCTVMPDYTSVDPGIIVQYTGATDANYINGYFYKCTNNGWELTDVQDVSDKVNKVAGATTDDLASLTATGDLADSGKKLSDLVLKSDVKDVLNSTSTTDPLSANQGKVLADNLAANENVYGAKNLNLYPYYDTTKSDNGIVFTDNGDGTVTVSGTAGATATMLLHNRIANSKYTLRLKAGNYKVNGCPSGSATSNYCMYLDARRVSDNVAYIIGFVEENGLAFTVSDESWVSLEIRVASGTVISTPITFKPMLCDARIIDPTFAPYAETNLQLTRKTSGLSNENLLDNPFFTVNQRGATTVTSPGYGADRWRYEAGEAWSSVVFSSSSATLTYVQIGQPFEKQLPNGTYTLSVKKSDGTIYAGTVVKSNDTSLLVAVNNADVYLAYNASQTKFVLSTYGKTTNTFVAVKLELGSVSTLLKDTAPNYTAELLKCQRYFYQMTNGTFNSVLGAGCAESATMLRLSLVLPVPMRSATPTVTFTGLLKAVGKGVEKTITSFIVRGNCSNVQVLSAVTTDLVSNELYTLVAESNSTLSLSADL